MALTTQTVLILTYAAVGSLLLSLGRYFKGERGFLCFKGTKKSPALTGL